MNPLREAVLLMTKEEVRAFKLYAQKVSVEGGRKDLDLFDQIRKNSDSYDEDTVLSRIYGDAPRNTFHRLKSRLLDTINRSLFDQYMDRNDALKLYHMLGIIDFYIQKRHFGLAHWFLRKAERLAIKIEHYECLDIILNEYIRLSNQLPGIDPTPFILRRKENQEHLQRIRQLDDILAAARHRATIAQTYGETADNLITLLATTVKEFSDDLTIRQSPVLRTKLFQAISRILLDKRDYVTLESYVRSVYYEFLTEGLFSKHNHEVKLQMITFLVNSLNKNRQYEASLESAKLLYDAMQEHDQMLHDKYLFFYYNALIINYFKMDLGRATTVLEEMMRNVKVMGTPFFALFVYTNLALAWYERRDLNKSVRYFVQTYLQDAYKVADPGLQLRLCVAELMVRQELRQYDVLQQRIRQVKQDFKGTLETPTYDRERQMIGLLHRMNETGEPQRDKDLKQAAMEFIALPLAEEQRDAELINYNGYLQNQLKI